MSLTDAQKGDALLLMGLPIRTDVTFGLDGHNGKKLRAAEVAISALNQANETQEALVVRILEQYDPIRFDEDTLQTQGLDTSAARTRARLRRDLANVLGVSLPSDGPPSIRRG